MRALLIIALFFPLLSLNSDQYTQTTITTDELALYNMIMEYRKAEGLETIPLSNSLTIVAQTHSKDLADNKPDLEKKCNAHSWSDKGKWSSCCYTSDHKQADCMWNKPKELTTYTGMGFEIAVGSSEPAFEDYVMTPEYALKSWKGSYHHNNVILNKDIWKDSKWNAIGIGIHKGFATVWFGKKEDPEGEPRRGK